MRRSAFPPAASGGTHAQLGGKSRFELSNAGHVASLVNRPGNPKVSYMLGPEPGAEPEEWRAQSTRRDSLMTLICSGASDLEQ